MPFTQTNRTNTAQENICNGCNERCKLGYHQQNNSTHSEFLPTIGGLIITNYIDKQNRRIRTASKYYCEDAIKLARQISHLCDNYRTRQK